MSSIKLNSAFDTVAEDKGEANNLQIRADLIIVMRDIVEENQWSLAEIAKKLKLTQRSASDLLSGKIEAFSIEQLISCFYQIGYRFKPIYSNKTLSVEVLAA